MDRPLVVQLYSISVPLTVQLQCCSITTAFYASLMWPCDSSSGGGGSVRSAVSSILFLSFRLMRISLIKVSGPPWAVRERRNDSAVVYNNDDRKNKNENERVSSFTRWLYVLCVSVGRGLILRSDNDDDNNNKRKGEEKEWKERKKKA